MRVSRRGLLGWLLLALLWAPTLGQLHRVVHVLQAGHAPVRADEAHAGDREGLLDALLGDHETESRCRLFDQSAGTDALAAVPFVALPAVPLFVAILCSPGVLAARRIALCEARGPPPVR